MKKFKRNQGANTYIVKSVGMEELYFITSLVFVVSQTFYESNCIVKKKIKKIKIS